MHSPSCKISASPRSAIAVRCAALRVTSQTPDHFDPARLNQTFRIAMTDASQITLLPRLMAAVRSDAPNVDLSVRLIGPQTRRQLRDGELDLALGYVPELGEDMMVQRLFFQDWVCLSSLQRRLSLADYATAEHVEVTSGTGNALLDHALFAASIERRVSLRLPGFLGLAGVLANSALVATMPRHIATTLAHLSELFVIDCPVAIERFAVSQCWHERRARDPAQRWLRECSRKAFHVDGVVAGWSGW
jgi:DNA-binding transcriptional LysR family regulator